MLKPRLCSLSFENTIKAFFIQAQGFVTSKIDRFSLKDFHDKILKEGSLPLNVLESHIEN